MRSLGSATLPRPRGGGPPAGTGASSIGRRGGAPGPARRTSGTAAVRVGAALGRPEPHPCAPGEVPRSSGARPWRGECRDGGTVRCGPPGTAASMPTARARGELPRSPGGGRSGCSRPPARRGAPRSPAGGGPGVAAGPARLHSESLYRGWLPPRLAIRPDPPPGYGVRAVAGRKAHQHRSNLPKVPEAQRRCRGHRW
jgi:hypothetical protein